MLKIQPMKKITAFILIAGTLLMLASCGINSSLVVNQNQSATQVQLSGKNFKVTDRISGSASVKYIMLVGGLRHKQLYDNAYAAMVAKAGLTGGARALVNIVTEEHIGGLPPFYYKRTITVSGHV